MLLAARRGAREALMQGHVDSSRVELRGFRAEQLSRRSVTNVQTLWKKDLRHFDECLR
jgi:hypothetical protein